MAERKTYLLIETADGERQLVKGLDGYEGCRVIRDRVPERPTEHCRLSDDGEWVNDKDAARRAHLQSLSNADLFDLIMEAVDARVKHVVGELQRRGGKGM